MNSLPDNHKPGASLWCRIEAPEPGGYAITTVKTGIKGFLPSSAVLEIGRIVPSTFVCMDGARALFTFAFTLGKSALVQNSKASDQENAFAVWTDAHHEAASFRRAIDIIMPPIGPSPIIVKLKEGSAKEIFPTLEETSFTGCMKIYCQSRLSRSALLFLNGRAVGSIYTKKEDSQTYSLAAGIKHILEDVSAADLEADLEMYELPRGIALSLSALFLGYTDCPENNNNNLGYTEKLLSHFAGNKTTACFGLHDSKSDTTVALGFIADGAFQGSYLISQRIFVEDKGFLLNMMLQQTQLKLQTHIVPAAMTTGAVRYGYSLSSGQFAL